MDFPAGAGLRWISVKRSDGSPRQPTLCKLTSVSTRGLIVIGCRFTPIHCNTVSWSAVFVHASCHVTLETTYEAFFCQRNLSSQNQEPYQEIGAFPPQETEHKYSSERFLWGGSSEKMFPILGAGARLLEEFACRANGLLLALCSQH